MHRDGGKAVERENRSRRASKGVDFCLKAEEEGNLWETDEVQRLEVWGGKKEKAKESFKEKATFSDAPAT